MGEEHSVSTPQQRCFGGNVLAFQGENLISAAPTWLSEQRLGQICTAKSPEGPRAGTWVTAGL